MGYIENVNRWIKQKYGEHIDYRRKKIVPSLTSNERSWETIADGLKYYNHLCAVSSLHFLIHNDIMATLLIKLDGSIIKLILEIDKDWDCMILQSWVSWCCWSKGTYNTNSRLNVYMNYECQSYLTVKNKLFILLPNVGAIRSVINYNNIHHYSLALWQNNMYYFCSLKTMRWMNGMAWGKFEIIIRNQLY